MLARRLNDGNALHSRDLRSFNQTYSAEIRGLVDLYGPVMMDAVEVMARKEGIGIENKSEKDRLDDITPWT